MAQIIEQSNCFVCGQDTVCGLKLIFSSNCEGEVEATVKLSSDYEGYPGIIHGGIVSSVLDEAVSKAQKSKKDRLLVTAQLNTRFKLPMRVDTEYIVKGYTGANSGKICKATGVIIDNEGTIIAEAEAILVEMSPDILLQ